MKIIRFIKCTKTNNGKTNTALQQYLLHMFKLMFMKICQRKKCFIFRFFCFKVNMFSTIYSIKINRRFCLEIRFCNHCSTSFRIMYIYNLYWCWFFVNNRAIIHKKPTPVQIVNVHYPKRSAAVITEAYFQAKSTIDFNGIYRGKHIDFEAKETKNKTLFPLANFHEHQFKHMEQVLLQGGICFAIIRFRTFNETYYFHGNLIINYLHQMINNGKKAIH